MLTELLLPDEAGIQVDQLEIREDRVIISVSHVRTCAACPSCHREAVRRHSHYQRKPADVACGGRRVQLKLQVRRFFCDNPECPRQTFGEGFPGIVATQARRTKRLAEQQQQMALVAGGEGGARLLRVLAMPTSADTLLRLMRNAPEPVLPTPRVLGVDDFALRKGLSYGTILVDLETHRPVDLLPERSTETFAAWLQDHPGVEIISRDRGVEYSKGATQGAPSAIQVADRWHLLKNLREAVEWLVRDKPACLRAAAEPRPETLVLPPSITPPVCAPEATPLPATEPIATPPALTKAAQRKQTRLVRKQARHEQVRTLHAEGRSVREICRQMQMSFYTVRKYLQAGKCPGYPEGVKRGGSKLERFLDYLTARWQAGCHNASQLWREIEQQGFTGSRGLVAKWAATQRQLLPTKVSHNQSASPLATPTKPVIPWSAGRTAWLLVTPESVLEATEQQALLRIKQADATVAQAHQLVHAFQQMLREQNPDPLLSWLHAVTASGIAALVSFANGIRQDFAAVYHALALPWSNGQTEGQVNRLKVFKRQMYGRANFDLLRLRVLADPLRL